MSVVLRAGDVLQVITVGATQSLDYVTDQVDKDNSNPPIITTAGADGNIAAATAGTTISAVVAANHEATIKWVSLTNVHASASFTVQLGFLKSGGTLRKIGGAYTLAPGECLVWNGDGTIFAFDATPGVKSSLAVALRRVVLTGSGTYIPPTNCRAIDVMAIGGGGGSGGVPGAAASVSVSGGGGSGSYAQKMFSPPAAAGYAYACGAAGAAGAAGANAGGAGGQTTFGGLAAPGGGAGPAGIAAATTDLVADAGIGGTVATGGDVNASGTMGFPGHRTSGTVGRSGGGGDSIIGGGGNAKTAAGGGTVGDANTGGGAGGAISTSATTQAGAVGSAGVIIVIEYY